MSNAYKLANETLNELVNMTLIDPETFVKHLNTPLAMPFLTWRIVTPYGN